MEKTSAPVRWWDWASIALLFLLMETVAARLVATTWTPFLYLTQTATYIAAETVRHYKGEVQL